MGTGVGHSREGFSCPKDCHAFVFGKRHDGSALVFDITGATCFDPFDLRGVHFALFKQCRQMQAHNQQCTGDKQDTEHRIPAVLKVPKRDMGHHKRIGWIDQQMQCLPDGSR